MHICSSEDTSRFDLIILCKFRAFLQTVYIVLHRKDIHYNRKVEAKRRGGNVNSCNPKITELKVITSVVKHTYFSVQETSTTN